MLYIQESNKLSLPEISESELDSMIEDSKKQAENENKHVAEDESESILTHRKRLDQREVLKMAMAERTLDLVTNKLANKFG